ncbi:hypothetical protein GCM10023083_59880 [Streptomyces phyllanthi]
MVGQDIDRFADVAVDGGDADAEPGRELREMKVVMARWGWDVPDDDKG